MIAKATDSFERKQRRCLDLLDEPTLFTGVPKLSLALVATPREGHAFSVGDECRLALDANRRLLVVQGVTVVGHVENPPSSVIDMMQGPCPSAFGQVSRMFTLTGKAEVQLE
ncbi:MAG: hypothetical protein KF724_11430 [Phycisphaeraceae bacterium]|nr:hypothetical protein [Phycisphaeraceae bacterium]